MENNNEYNLKLCLENANAFYNVACLIDKKENCWDFKENMLSAYVVNLTLSCELFLKFLLLNNNSGIINSHELKRLNDKLVEVAPKIAEEVKEYYYQENNITNQQFEMLLELSNDSFVDFRYSHENKKEELLIHSTDVSSLARALKRVCEKYESL